jgi:Leucine-rich repeat (LRR) protein
MTDSDHELDEEVPFDRASANQEPQVEEVDAIQGKYHDTSHTMATNVNSTVALTQSIPQQGLATLDLESQPSPSLVHSSGVTDPLSTTHIPIKPNSPLVTVPINPEELAEAGTVAYQTTPVQLSIEQLDTLLATSLSNEIQDQIAKQKAAATGGQSKAITQGMMPSSGVPRRAHRELRQNDDAKVASLEPVLLPMESGESQENLEPTLCMASYLGAASQEPTVEETTILAEDFLFQEKIQKFANRQEDTIIRTGSLTHPPLEEQHQAPTLKQFPNVQLQVQQPGAYNSRPGGFIQRNDDLSFALVAPITSNSSTIPIEPPPVSSGNHQPSIEETAYPLEVASSIANSGLVEARAVTGQSSLNMMLLTAQQVDADELAEEQVLAAVKEQKERECHRVGYCIVAGTLVVLAISLGVLLGTRKLVKITITNAPTLSPSMIPSAVPSSAPTGHLDLLQLDLPDYTQESLQNSSTPQWQALQWLHNHQNIAFLPEWRKKQLFALATFFYAFEGENWPDIIRREWMDDKVDECLWFSSKYGLFDNHGKYVEQETTFYDTEPCNNHGEFQMLLLANLELENLNPSIPPEVTLLSALSILALPFNNISAQISSILTSELYQMANLTVLNMHSNLIRGNLPSELGLMTQMTTLLLSSNSLSGSIPSELGLMTNMTHLYIDFNSLSGSIPSELGSMYNMTDLFMYSNSLIGSIPSELGLMTHMTYLLMDYNSLSGSMPSELGSMSNMIYLFLFSNSLSGSIPSELGLMTNMTHLFMDFNSLSGSIPSELGLMTSLAVLSLNDNSLNGSICSEIGQLTSLEELSLRDNSFIGTVPSELGQLTHLAWLDLTNLTLLVGSIPSELFLLNSLGYLDLSGSRGLSGTISDAFCYLQETPCTFQEYWGESNNCTLDFDCTTILCGCDCPCFNGTVSNETEAKVVSFP